MARRRGQAMLLHFPMNTDKLIHVYQTLQTLESTFKKNSNEVGTVEVD